MTNGIRTLTGYPGFDSARNSEITHQLRVQFFLRLTRVFTSENLMIRIFVIGNEISNFLDFLGCKRSQSTLNFKTQVSTKRDHGIMRFSEFKREIVNSDSHCGSVSWTFACLEYSLVKGFFFTGFQVKNQRIKKPLRRIRLSPRFPFHRLFLIESLIFSL